MGGPRLTDQAKRWHKENKHCFYRKSRVKGENGLSLSYYGFMTWSRCWGMLALWNSSIPDSYLLHEVQNSSQVCHMIEYGKLTWQMYVSFSCNVYAIRSNGLTLRHSWDKKYTFINSLHYKWTLHGFIYASKQMLLRRLSSFSLLTVTVRVREGMKYSIHKIDEQISRDNNAPANRQISSFKFKSSTKQYSWLCVCHVLIVYIFAD